MKGFDIRETSIIMCRMQYFITYYFLQLSSCTLCLLSIDRFFGIVLALKAFQFNRSSIARKVVLILLCLIALFNLHFLLFMGYYSGHSEQYHTSNETNFVVCDVDKINQPIYKKFWRVYFFFDNIIYTQIPFMVMIVCNVCIVANIVKSRVRSKQVIIDRKKRKDKFKSKTSSNQILKNTNAMLATEKRISITLVSISFSFLVLTLPVFVVELLKSNLLF